MAKVLLCYKIQVVLDQSAILYSLNRVDLLSRSNKMVFSKTLISRINQMAFWIKVIVLNKIQLLTHKGSATCSMPNLSNSNHNNLVVFGTINNSQVNKQILCLILKVNNKTPVSTQINRRRHHSFLRIRWTSLLILQARSSQAQVNHLSPQLQMLSNSLSSNNNLLKAVFLIRILKILNHSSNNNQVKLVYSSSLANSNSSLVLFSLEVREVLCLSNHPSRILVLLCSIRNLVQILRLPQNPLFKFKLDLVTRVAVSSQGLIPNQPQVYSNRAQLNRVPTPACSTHKAQHNNLQPRAYSIQNLRRLLLAAYSSLQRTRPNKLPQV